MSKFRLRGRARGWKRQHEKRQDRVPLRAIVPNLITSMAACAGVTSIAFASEGRWIAALWALLVACICDGMDGRVARFLKASSKLGAELDSLADFVNFGVAPAMFMYFWLTGKYFGAAAAQMEDPRLVRFVLAAALFYAMCDCFRLARFNTMLEQPPLPYWKHFFMGVPAPGGCWMVLSPAMLSLAFAHKETHPACAEFFQNPYFGIAVLLFVGALMASRLPTISLKAVHLNRKALPAAMAFLLLLIALLVTNFWITLGVMGVLYVFTVPVTGWFFVRARAKHERLQPVSA
ncbi:MAG: phosphatidylcholine/phosphatidylserine synthase [Kiritimatiellae bacterium]|nr:phosphatidylcholine/phosphatidylserine synthase [Kiritimatiellia bacterium]